MMGIFLLTILVVAISTLYVFSARFVQRIALFIGATQIALLAVSDKIDSQLSDIATGFNHAISSSYSVVIHKIICFV